MSQHSEVEARIVDELRRAGLMGGPQQSSPESLTYDDLPRLPYLQAVIKVITLSSPSSDQGDYPKVVIPMIALLE